MKTEYETFVLRHKKRKQYLLFRPPGIWGLTDRVDLAIQGAQVAQHIAFDFATVPIIVKTEITFITGENNVQTN